MPDIIHKYEITCLISNEGKQKKEELIQTVKDLIAPNELEVGKLKAENLAWKERLDLDSYLVFSLETSPTNMKEKVEKTLHSLQNSLILELFLIINLDKESKLRIKNFSSNNSPKESDSAFAQEKSKVE